MEHFRCLILIQKYPTISRLYKLDNVKKIFSGVILVGISPARFYKYLSPKGKNKDKILLFSISNAPCLTLS